MTDNISCVIEDGNKKIIKDSLLNFASIKNILWKIDAKKEKYKHLHEIDEYNDTRFITSQTPILISELEKVNEEIQNKSINNLIREFILFLSDIKIGKYIVFYGD